MIQIIIYIVISLESLQYYYKKYKQAQINKSTTNWLVQLLCLKNNNHYSPVVKIITPNQQNMSAITRKLIAN